MLKFYLVNYGNLKTKKFNTLKSAKDFMMMLEIDCYLESYNKNGKFIKLVSFVNNCIYCKL